MRNRFSSFASAADIAAQRPLGGVSQVRGASEPPLLALTIGALLDQTAERWPEQPACVFAAAGVRWTWRELREQVDQVAAGLLCLGVQRGERVGIWSPNRPEWVLVQLATARIGAVLVNINPAYRLAELDYALNKVQVKLLVCAAGFKGSHYLDMLDTLAPEIAQHPAAGAQALQLPGLPALQHIVHMQAAPRPGMLGFEALRTLAGPAQRQRVAVLGAQLDPHDAINIQFTSGTTGQPKGATLTHHNVVNNARSVGLALRLQTHDRLCIPVPLYHCFGMVMGVLACTVSGSCMVFPGEGFEPSETLRVLAQERCTALHGVPTMFVAMLGAPDFAQHDLSSLRTGIMAGAPCPIVTMRQVMADMHMPEVTIAYGMTETSPVSFQSAVDDPIERRVGTVGRVLPHLEVKLVDAQGEVVPLGQTGELWTRGYSVMQGYWGDAQRTRDSVVDGWMRTGDLATLDEQGYCNIVGRVKDMVIRGGENIYPREVEEFLFRHPQVAAVQVFGVPDERYGEELCAWIVTKPGQVCTEDAIRAFCRDNIAHYKVPRYVRFVDEIPVTVTGKPQKFVMREAMVRELGLPGQAAA
jgi:fatty-acyl-CoA synthase